MFLILICGLPVWYRPTKRITSERAGLRGSHCFIPVLLFSHAVYELPFIVGSRSQHRSIPTVATRHLQHRDQVASGDYRMSVDGDWRNSDRKCYRDCLLLTALLADDGFLSWSTSVPGFYVGSQMLLTTLRDTGPLLCLTAVTCHFVLTVVWYQRSALE